MTAATVALPRPASSAVAVRLCCVAALALFAALQWATLARPLVAGPMVASVALASVAAVVIAHARMRLVVVAVSLALVPLGLLVAGASVGDLLPEGWGGLASDIGDGLAALPGIHDVRGAGLMLGAELDRPAADVVAACAERSLLVGTAGADVLRLTPPLIVTTAEIEHALGVLEEVLA